MDNPIIQQQLVSLQDNLYRFALKLTEDRVEAQDLLQETSLKALDNDDKFIVGTNFKGWVFTLMRNIFINNYRRMVRNQKIFTQDEELYNLNIPAHSEFCNPDESVSYRELTEKLDNLEEVVRIPFTMHVAGYRYDEISEQLNIPIGTVKSRIFLARKRLMKSLQEYK